MKRILDCQGSDFRRMGREELLAAIAGAEGRTIACETIGSIMPMLGDITNAEFAAAMGGRHGSAGKYPGLLHRRPWHPAYLSADGRVCEPISKKSEPTGSCP